MRVENWPTKLQEALKTEADKTFAWGENDCFYWTNRVIEEITGRDNMYKFFEKRGFTPSRPYMTGKGMLRTIKKLGFSSFLQIVKAIYGDPINPKSAQRGDILMLKIEGYQALGICRGIDVMFKTREGNAFYLPSNCEYAWRIK